VIHKSVFEKIGLFDTGLMRQEDYDMWVRIACQYPHIGYIADPLAIVHLELVDPVLTARRLDEKRGIQFRDITQRYIDITKDLGCFDDFKVLASVLVRHALLITLFHGLKEDARETVSQFPQLVGWHWRIAAYVLTVSPKATAKVMQMMAYLADKLKLARCVSRRWVHLKISHESHRI
jgi:hypothetical protein